MRRGHPALPLAQRLALCDWGCPLETAVSLKWVPWQSKLVRHLHYRKENKAVRAPTTAGF